MMEVLEARRNDILVLALKGCLSATSVPSVLNLCFAKTNRPPRMPWLSRFHFLAQ
jgi:hypothetical protein